MSTFQVIDIAIELVFLFPIALAAFNTVAKRRKVAQLWEECQADRGEWLAEVQQAVFTPDPQDWEPTAEERDLVESFPAIVSAYWQQQKNRPVDVIVPFRRKVATVAKIDLSGYSIRQLRVIARVCKVAYINRYDKPGLIAQILAQPSDRLSVALQQVAA